MEQNASSPFDFRGGSKARRSFFHDEYKIGFHAVVSRTFDGSKAIRCGGLNSIDRVQTSPKSPCAWALAREPQTITRELSLVLPVEVVVPLQVAVFERSLDLKLNLARSLVLNDTVLEHWDFEGWIAILWRLDKVCMGEV